MSEHRLVRRCAVLMIEPRERLQPDLEGLLSGASPFRAEMTCVALAPHVGTAIELDEKELAALMRIGETPWVPLDKLAGMISPAVAERLLRKGLLIGDGVSHAQLRERDDAMREGHWRSLSAVAHYFSRWSDTGVDEDARITRHRSITDLVDEYGLPPPHLTERTQRERRVRLPPCSASPLGELFRQRVTCRNFDTSATLTHHELGDC
jgi:hypothetical protein